LLVLGHGSGSFGHTVAKQYGTRQGVRTRDEWFGFVATADAAYKLTRIVTQVFIQKGLPVWSIQPSVALRCEDGVVVDGPIDAVQQALGHGLIPMVHGDVVLDSVRGGTIASTEEIFDWLAIQLAKNSMRCAAQDATQVAAPSHIILAGEVDGIYDADPQLNDHAKRIPLITPTNMKQLQQEAQFGASYGVDVTGGMTAKVDQALRIVQGLADIQAQTQQHHKSTDVLVCSGLIPDRIKAVLSNPETAVGTRISAQ